MLAARFSRLLVVLVSAALVCAGGASADPVDANAPQIILETPAAGAFFYQGQSAQAAYACLPGQLQLPVISCVGDVPLGAPIDTGRVGTHTFTVAAEDYLGAVTTITHTYTVVDVIPPAVTIATPADRAVYSLGQPVTASYSCDDGPGGSGVLACLGSLPDGTEVASGEPLPTDRLGTFSVIVTAFDQAGNRGTAQHVYQVADVTPPTISIAQPTAPIGDRGPVYRLNQTVYADYACDDDSGFVSCTGSVPAGSALDTSSLGTHTFRVIASDGSRNSATATRSYSVVYDFGGFAPPLQPLPSLATAKAGEQLPVKFSLQGAFGLGAVQSVSSQSIDCATADPLADSVLGRGSLSYSAGPDRYTFTWTTDRAWIGSCRELAVTLRDGTTHRANIRFTK